MGKWFFRRKQFVYVPQSIFVLFYGHLMLIRTIILLILTIGAAHAQDATLRYASFPSLATAQALSASAWAAVRCTPQPQCDPAQVTQFNYPIITLVNGNSAIVLHTGDVFQGEHLTLANGKSFNLTAGQIASLQTRAQVGTQLPDILSVALINSRITAPQLAAINTYAGTHAAFNTTFTAIKAGPSDLASGVLQGAMAELVAAGVITSATAAIIYAPQTTAAVNP